MLLQIINQNYLSQLLTEKILAHSLPNHFVLSQIPTTLTSIRDTFIKNSKLNGSFFVVILISLAVILITMLLKNSFKNLKQKTKPQQGDPEKLFDDLLGHLKLSDADKTLLREMATGARLRHPTMCLLSPQLLDWARKLWLNEKGKRKVTPEKFQRISQISIRLYDHQIPQDHSNPRQKLRRNQPLPRQIPTKVQPLDDAQKPKNTTPQWQTT